MPGIRIGRSHNIYDQATLAKGETAVSVNEIKLMPGSSMSQTRCPDSPSSDSATVMHSIGNSERKAMNVFETTIQNAEKVTHQGTHQDEITNKKGG